MQELERGDSGVRSFASVQGALVMYPIHAFGSEEQKQRWLPAMASGEAHRLLWPDRARLRLNPRRHAHHRQRDRDGYVLNGEKRWITSGGLSDVAVVWAKCEDGAVRGFLVERGLPGFSTRDIHGKFSLRASVTSELIFEDCLVPKSAMLPGVKGLRGPLSCLNQARFGISFGAVGAAMACYDEALSYTKDRVQFARQADRQHQLVQLKLVDMLQEITKAQLLSLQLGRLKEAGKIRPQQVSWPSATTSRWR
jgi:glutaryl-CoA dehydrogenase